jgi:thioredoxin 1
MFGPVFEAASEKHPDVVFAKVDTEAERSLAGAAGITSIPTLMAFRDGILLFRQPGALPAPSLEELIGSIKAVDMEEIKKEVAAQEAQLAEGKE